MHWGRYKPDPAKEMRSAKPTLHSMGYLGISTKREKYGQGKAVPHEVQVAVIY
jgi:hypothetical protein